MSIRRPMSCLPAAALCVGLASVHAASPAAMPSEPSKPQLSIQELMDSRVDPAADVLWDSVAFIASAKGEEDRRPRTPAEWAALRRSALALLAAADELSVPGRRVATFERTAGPGELEASAIQRLIDSNPRGFARRAQGLRSAATKALTAIDAWDADELMNAGGSIDDACEACHAAYWYPDQARDAR